MPASNADRAPLAAAEIVPVVLAAGKGERLGGNKALLDVGGAPALCRILRAAAGAGLGPPVVVLGHAAERVRAMIDAEAQEFAVRCVVNPDPDRGQTSSVQCGIAALAAGAGAALVWPVDHPLVTSDDVAALATAASAHPAAAVVLPTHGGRAGHPVLIRRTLFAAMLALAPGSPLRDLLRGEREHTVFVERPADSVLRDLDTPADLAAAQFLHGKESPA
jgi:molybdenum cofactor cytidylyltransferase